MRFAGTSHPEWGYLAPAPSFLRTARIVLVAAAVGATAGAGVVLSLVDNPAGATAESSVAARTLVRQVETAATPVSAAPAAQTNAPAAIQNQPMTPTPTPALTLSSADSHETVVVASESGAGSTDQASTSIAALAEVPAAPAPVIQAAPEPTPAANAAQLQKKAAAKKHHSAWRGGPLALLPGDDYLSAGSGGSYRDERWDRDGRRDRDARWDRDGHWGGFGDR